MFVQVIQGGVKDPDGLRKSLDRWITDLGPKADGWLGTTWGLYGDKEFIVLARFASADAAKRNSERPEQGTWWAEVASSLEGESRFSDFDDVILLGPGGSDAAGFVQVMQGRVVDVERERAMTRDFAQRPMDFRPDILGGVAAIGDDGTFVQAIYFTSEAEAREGEQKPMPPDMQEMMEQSQANTTEMNFIDLTSPTFASAT
ncbi:MAG TPA: hypothetical protein VIT65_19290 [Microlunatus sp.]